MKRKTKLIIIQVNLKYIQLKNLIMKKCKLQNFKKNFIWIKKKIKN